ncbi:MAG: PSD1 and planctomycete cytochrome C domain-containing protein [Planctomycetota bacterium]|nr:PSD1 and planctomycete cytochrome C domain-containing protein [Planctomycetota bacterium]
MHVPSVLPSAGLLAVGLISSPSSLPARAAVEEVDYARDVHPILADHCLRCHGEKKQKGDLRLDTRAGLFESEDPEWVPVVPGDPDAGTLLERVVLPADDPDVMPAKGELLTAEEIALLRRWIAEGADWEAVAAPAEPELAGLEVGPLVDALLAGSAGAPPVDFDSEVRPILSENCFLCHGPDGASREAGLRLDLPEGLLEPSGLGGEAAVVAGDAHAGSLPERLIHPDPAERMPPADSGRALDDEQRATLLRWIAEGAVWEEHWAFQAPRAPTPPAVEQQDWPDNEIDRFVLARLEAAGLSPAPEADGHTLLRRVTLDLTGLPPTSDEVAAFVADDEPGAFERVVDRLLASPRYGEHSARFWLDAARYGDTHGLHLDNYREMWPYRDWVIAAFNENLPFDRFTIEQLAGDLLPDADLDQQVATGFNRCHVTTNEGGSIAEEVYVRNVVDRVNTIGTVFMGMTIGCAACHDHKFDPITQREYYGLFGFFNNLDANPMDGNAKVHAPVVRVPDREQCSALAALDDQDSALQSEVVELLAGLDYTEPPRAERAEALPKTAKVWVDDDVPAGVVPESGPLEWAEAPDAPVLRGRRSMKRSGAGRHQHVFRVGDDKLRVGEGDVLFASVFLDPQDPPREIMLQFNGNGGADWGHRAFWGENLIPWGTDGTSERRRLGDLPSPGGWVKLEVPVESVGLAPGSVVHGMAFTQFDGTAWWDEAGILSGVEQEPVDHDWIDDGVPEGASSAGDGATWSWVGGGDHPVLSGERSLRRSGGDGLNQDYFTGARPLVLAAGDRLYAHVWLDPQDPPRSVQLQFNDGTWGHRARWGEPAHGKGATGGADHRAGDLPPLGSWVRLEVPIASVDLKPGDKLNGWAFTQVGGTLWWDRAGVRTWAPPNDRYLVSQRAWEALAASDGKLPQDVRAALGVVREARSAEQADVLRGHYLRHVHAPTRELFSELNDRSASIVSERERIDSQVPTTLVMKERSEVRPAYFLDRGQYDMRKEEVARSTPSMLPPMDPSLPADRLGFSRWLVDPEHPLTARVTVNRFWQQLFGVGLVETSEDFGNQGSRPSHPRLLDWLATRFVADGWDVKRTLKRMVLSATYRQAAHPDVLSRELDPDNRLLSRGPRFRLGAEVLRDQALALSGLLVEKVGGPSVKPPQPDGLWYAVGYTSSNTARFKADEGPEAVHRRTLYTFLKRTSPPPQMSTFDAPSRESSCVRRERTNTPLQALLLMNDPQYVEAASALARRILNEGGETAAQRAKYALELVTCRPAASADVEDVLALLSAQEAEFRTDPNAARALLVYGGGEAQEGADPALLAGWTVVANLLLNLDEVIVKG